MKSSLTALALIAACGLALTVNAQEGPANGQGPQGRRGPKMGPPGPLREILREKADADGDGKVTPEELKAAHEALLKKYDANGDGEIDDDERLVIIKERTAEFVQKYDKDGDGKLSVDELVVARQELRGKLREDLGARRGEMPAKGGERREEMIKKFDKDGDGKLSEEERAAIREQHQNRRPEAAAKPE